MTKRFDLAGGGPWSEKAGATYAPASCVGFVPSDRVTGAPWMPQILITGRSLVVPDSHVARVLN
jgi:hypothetical protein